MLLLDDLVDFAKYDANNDGIVDLVYIIYAGHSANYHGNKVSNIWPKSGTITISNKFDGKSIRRYGVSNELNGSDKTSKNNKKINGIGLFCHEFSHTLGLPDIYAYHTDAEIKMTKVWNSGTLWMAEQVSVVDAYQHLILHGSVKLWVG